MNHPSWRDNPLVALRLPRGAARCVLALELVPERARPPAIGLYVFPGAALGDLHRAHFLKATDPFIASNKAPPPPLPPVLTGHASSLLPY
jgi:hypothetical protein